MGAPFKSTQIPMVLFIYHGKSKVKLRGIFPQFASVEKELQNRVIA